MPANCAVIYLERFCNKPYFSRTFLSSIQKHRAGSDFDYVHVLKGFAEASESEPLSDFRAAYKNVEVLRYPDEMSALDVMCHAAAQLPHEKVLVLLSWSRILAPFWLRSYLSAFDTVPGCGIVGATGSFERRNYKDLSEPFPNISIRTTGFMVERKLFVELGRDSLTTREDELMFEAGEQSMTRRIMGMGLNPVVIDKNGNAWPVEQWPFSKTFRSGAQEGLLIADNRTHDYAVSKDKRRRWLSDLAWGAGVSEVSKNPFYKRLKAHMDWKYRAR